MILFSSIAIGSLNPNFSIELAICNTCHSGCSLELFSYSFISEISKYNIFNTCSFFNYTSSFLKFFSLIEKRHRFNSDVFCEIFSKNKKSQFLH
jgi:hypothetical protein